LPVLLQPGMDRRAGGYGKLKVILYAFQICGMAYEVHSTHDIRDSIHAAARCAFLVFVEELFFSVHRNIFRQFMDLCPTQPRSPVARCLPPLL